MNNVQHNLNHIRQVIDTTAQQCGRDPKTITLVAVSKTKPVTMIEQALHAGQVHFGENYVQEGVEKVIHFQSQDLVQRPVWHFIGPLQSNKTKLVAEHFDWIHTIDRLKIAQRLDAQRPQHKSPLNTLIQINISDEESKSGIEPKAMLDLAAEIVKLPHLKLRGLMAIPAAEKDADKQFAIFQEMHSLFLYLQQHYPDIDTLSMGMSDDMTSAIKAGSTMVRIGSAIFGERLKQA
ncbi:YggS family pyridoxal phosphate-dependent enzyme [Zophobihabitans entericus]|uniref:Pyridoxal phosphate homeostasis protein n=1 Tax=Zophobihabitans entericus TaxID=1635327 RepID=A0A6G9IAS8_9GAMM|nr:YggS family pyridoxal phosphate-dependent enzyme [Zophobihabitans entericus]QIQ21331.1 YggS family pyridoxal phosphate-dependent enzyme [Zophobihabitans entericus]